MNDGKKFEKLAESVFNTLSRNEQYTNVQRDVKLEGPDGEKRQIDVLLETNVFGFKTTALVECRDYKIPLNISHVDGFHSKVGDLSGDVAILISRKGFSDNAIKKAKRRNIKLCTLDKPKDISDIGLDIRLLVAEILPSRVSLQYVNNSGSPFKQQLGNILFNGIPLMQFVRQGLESNYFKVSRDHKPIVWPETPGELVISNPEGQEITDAVMSIEYELSYYLGYLSELKDTVVFKNMSEGKTNVVYFLEEVRNCMHNFEKLSSDTKISLKAGQVMRVHMLVPNIEYSSIGGVVANLDGTETKYGDIEATKDFTVLPSPKEKLKSLKKT